VGSLIPLTVDGAQKWNYRMKAECQAGMILCPSAFNTGTVSRIA
jgi:hypothetical protein